MLQNICTCRGLKIFGLFAFFLSKCNTDRLNKGLPMNIQYFTCIMDSACFHAGAYTHHNALAETLHCSDWSFFRGSKLYMSNVLKYRNIKLMPAWTKSSLGKMRERKMIFCYSKDDVNYRNCQKSKNYCIQIGQQSSFLYCPLWLINNYIIIMLNAYLDFSSSLKIIYVFHVNTSKIPHTEYLYTMIT